MIDTKDAGRDWEGMTDEEKLRRAIAFIRMIASFEGEWQEDAAALVEVLSPSGGKE